MRAGRGRKRALTACVFGSRFQVLEHAKLVAPCTSQIWCGDLPKVSTGGTRPDAVPAASRADVLSRKNARAPRLLEPAPDSVGGWGHSRPVQALRALVLVQAVVAATKVSLKGRPEEHRAVTRAASLCWQMKMSKKQKEEHMQAALRPATERFVGYSPAMQKMISSQLAQVQPVGDARWPGVCGRASGSLGRHVCTTDAYHVSLWQASKPVWEWGYQPTNGSP